jgi:hypothetical protein
MHERSHERHVVVFDATAEGIRQQLLGNHAHKLIGVPHQRIAQAGDTIELGAIGQHAAGVDRDAFFLCPPRTDGVEVLEGNAHGLEDAMTGRARRVAPVNFQLLPHRQHSWHCRSCRWAPSAALQHPAAAAAAQGRGT